MFLRIVFICFFTQSTIIGRAQTDLSYIRNMFHQYNDDEEYLLRLISLESSDTNPENANIFEVYKAVGTTMLAEHSFLPLTKLNYFKQGVEKLELLISSNSCLENRYLRLLVQLNVPKLLNYHQHIEEDLNYLKQHMPESQLSFADKRLFRNSLLATKNAATYRTNINEIAFE